MHFVYINVQLSNSYLKTLRFKTSIPSKSHDQSIKRIKREQPCECMHLCRDVCVFQTSQNQILYCHLYFRISFQVSFPFLFRFVCVCVYVLLLSVAPRGALLGGRSASCSCLSGPGGSRLIPARATQSS